MAPWPLTLYRPTKTPDGSGGFTEALAAGVQLFGWIEVHKAETYAVIDAGEDAQIGDYLDNAAEVVGGVARYRVTAITRVPGTAYKRLALERVARPIEP